MRLLAIVALGLACASDERKTTACGPEQCDPDSEICLVRCGRGYTCEPVPAGCEEDRSCACVQDALGCNDPDPMHWQCSDVADENTVSCSSGIFCA